MYFNARAHFCPFFLFYSFYFYSSFSLYLSIYLPIFFRFCLPFFSFSFHNLFNIYKFVFSPFHFYLALINKSIKDAKNIKNIVFLILVGPIYSHF